MHHPHNKIRRIRYPTIVKVVGVASSSFCCTDHYGAGRSFLSRLPTVLTTKTRVVSIKTYSAHPNDAPIDRTRRLTHLHTTLPRLHTVTPSILLSISAFHPAITQTYVRRCNISVVGSISRNSSRVFSIIKTHKTACVLVSYRPAVRLAGTLFSQRLTHLRRCNYSRI